MKKNVIISVQGKQKFDGLDDDQTELVTPGLLYKKDSNIFLVYNESEITGMPDTKTTIRISSDEISVVRTGKYPTNMIFKAGQQNLSVYNTPYGPFTVTITTNKITNNIDENGGDLEVNYALELDHNHIGINNLKITVN